MAFDDDPFNYDDENPFGDDYGYGGDLEDFYESKEDEIEEEWEEKVDENEEQWDDVIYKTEEHTENIKNIVGEAVEEIHNTNQKKKEELRKVSEEAEKEYNKIIKEVEKEIKETYRDIDKALKTGSDDYDVLWDKLHGLFNLQSELGKLKERETETKGTLRAVKNAYERANYRSEIGGGIGGAVHHLDGYNWDVSDRINPDNLILLSEEIHDEFHSLYGGGNNTIEQFLEFLYAYHPEEASKFEKNYGANIPKSINTKLVNESPNWNDSLMDKQYGRYVHLPWLASLHEVGYNPSMDNIPYSSFFLKNMEVPIDGSYKIGSNIFDRAQLATTDPAVLDLYDSVTNANFESYKGKSDEELRNILLSRRFVEIQHGLDTGLAPFMPPDIARDYNGLLWANESDRIRNQNFTRGELLNELWESHKLGRNRLEEVVNGNYNIPFLGGYNPSIFDNEGLGKGLIPVLDNLKLFFDEYGEYLKMDNPFKDWEYGGSISDNREFLESLFSGKGATALSMLSRRLPVSSMEGVETTDDRIKKFGNEAYENHQKDKPDSRIEDFYKAVRSLEYIIGISRRGLDNETIGRFFKSDGSLRYLNDWDDNKSIINASDKEAERRVRKPHMLNSQINDGLKEMNDKMGGSPVNAYMGDMLVLAKELQKVANATDWINYLNEMQTVFVEGNSTGRPKTNSEILEELENRNRESLATLFGGDLIGNNTTIKSSKSSCCEQLIKILGEINTKINNVGESIAKALEGHVYAFGKPSAENILNDSRDEISSNESEANRKRNRESLNIFNKSPEEYLYEEWGIKGDGDSTIVDEDKWKEIRKKRFQETLDKIENEDAKKHFENTIRLKRGNKKDDYVSYDPSYSIRDMGASAREISDFYKNKEDWRSPNYENIQLYMDEYIKAEERAKSLRKEYARTKSIEIGQELSAIEYELRVRASFLANIQKKLNDSRYLSKNYKRIRELINKENDEEKRGKLIEYSRELEYLLHDTRLEEAPKGEDDSLRILRNYIAVRKNALKKMGEKSPSTLRRRYEQEIKDAEDLIKRLNEGEYEYFISGAPSSADKLNGWRETVFSRDTVGAMSESFSRYGTRFYKDSPFDKTTYEGMEKTPRPKPVDNLVQSRFSYLASQFVQLREQLNQTRHVATQIGAPKEVVESYNKTVDALKKVHDRMFELTQSHGEYSNSFKAIVKGYGDWSLSVDSLIAKHKELENTSKITMQSLTQSNQKALSDLFGGSIKWDNTGNAIAKVGKESSQATSNFTRFANNFDRATRAITGAGGALTWFFSVVGSGQALNDMVTASSLRQTNQIMLSARRGQEEATKLYDKIQMLVVKLPGNDTFLTNILTMLGTMDKSLTGSDLEYMGGVIADYYMGAQAKGQFNNETERELRNYLMTGQTRNLTNSIIASEIESLKGLNSVKERTVALEKALQKTGMDSIAHYDSYTNTFEEFKGRFQKSFADWGDLWLGFLQLGMKTYNTLDSLTNSFLSQMTIAIGIIALGFVSLIGILGTLVGMIGNVVGGWQNLTDVMNKDIDFIREDRFTTAIKESIQWIGVKIGILSEQRYAEMVTGGAVDAETASEIANTSWRELNIATSLKSIAVKGRDAIMNLWNAFTLYEVVDGEIVLNEAKASGIIIKLQSYKTSILDGLGKVWSAITSVGEAEAENIGIVTKLRDIATRIWRTGVIIVETIAMYGLAVAGVIADIALSPVSLTILAIVGAGLILVTVVEQIGEAFGWWSDFGSMFEAISAGLGRIWEAFWNNEKIQYAMYIINGFFENLMAFFDMSFLGGIWELLFGTGTGEEFDILSGIIDMLGAIGEFIWEISSMDEIIEVLRSVGALMGWVMRQWNAFVDSSEFQELIDGFREIRVAFGEIWTEIAPVFDELGKAWAELWGDEKGAEKLKEDGNELLELFKAIAHFIRDYVVPFIKLLVPLIKATLMPLVAVVKFITWIIEGVKWISDHFGMQNDKAPTNIANKDGRYDSIIEKQYQYDYAKGKDLAKRYINNNNGNSTVINNNFGEGSVQTNAHNMTQKEVRHLFTSAFGYNKANGVKGVLR